MIPITTNSSTSVKPSCFLLPSIIRLLGRWRFDPDSVAPMAQPFPIHRFSGIQIRVDDRAVSTRRGGHWFAGLGRNRAAKVVTADDKRHLVLDRTSAAQGFVAAPNGHEDDLRAACCELAGDLGIAHVPADHHADFAEIGVEDGKLMTGRESAIALGIRETDLPILADEL